MNNKEQIAANNERIRQIIKDRGFMLIDVANALGISQSGMWAVFNGDMSLTRAQKIAEFIGCSLDELLGYKSCDEAKLVCPHCGKPISIKIE